MITKSIFSIIYNMIASIISFTAWYMMNTSTNELINWPFHRYSSILTNGPDYRILSLMCYCFTSSIRLCGTRCGREVSNSMMVLQHAAENLRFLCIMIAGCFINNISVNNWVIHNKPRYQFNPLQNNYIQTFTLIYKWWQGITTNMMKTQVQGSNIYLIIKW